MSLIKKIGAVLVTNAKTAYSETKELVKSSAAARLESIMKFAEPHNSLGNLLPAPTPVQKEPGPIDPLVDLRVRAEQGDPDAQNSLGFAYYRGDIVVKDLVESAKWYRKAAEQGNSRARYRLGKAYATGEGVEQDMVEAVKWYRKAAEQGDAAAQFNIGDAYRLGKGVGQDLEEADRWYALAGGLK